MNLLQDLREAIADVLSADLESLVADPDVKVIPGEPGAYSLHIPDPAKTPIVTSRIEEHPDYVVTDHHQVETGVAMTVQHVVKAT